MRHLPFIMTAASLIALAAPAQAEPRAEYVALVLQAFAAKMNCPDTDVAYQDLVQKANEMHLPDGTTEQVRKAIAFMLTGERMGERGDDDLMRDVAMATQSTDFDQKRLGLSQG